MSRKKGYDWEHEVEGAMMGLRDQHRSDPLFRRSHRVPASGAMDGLPGDVITDLDFLQAFGQFMFECKYRKDDRGRGRSFSIKKDEVDKLVKEARQQGQVPAYAFRFKGEGVQQDRAAHVVGDPANTRWVALPLREFVRLLEYTRDLWDEGRGDAEEG